MQHTFEEVTAALGDSPKKRSAADYRYQCPVCKGSSDDALSISPGDNGYAVYHCFKGCSDRRVGEAIDNIVRSVVFVDGFAKLVEEETAAPKPTATKGQMGDSKPAAKISMKFVCAYDYTDKDGKVIYRKTRHEAVLPDENGNIKKEFKYKPSLKSLGIKRIPYNLPATIASDIVFAVEGEKDADRLNGLGLVATCSKNWLKEWNDILAGKTIYIIPDNDKEGARIAKKTMAQLYDWAKVVKVVKLPGLGPKGDVSDWLDKGNTANTLMELCTKTKPAATTPESVSKPDGEFRTTTDEYGELTEKRTTRGGWKDYSRELNGIVFRLDNKRSTGDYINALKASKIDLRLNVMNDKLIVSGGMRDLPQEQTPIDDILTANLQNWVFDIGLLGIDRINRAMQTAAYRNRYHPVRDYFRNLKWDGSDNLAGLYPFLGFDSDIGKTFLRRWMIGAVAKIFDGKQNYMLVLDGRQGIGKSFFTRWLCPLPGHFIEGAIRPEDKDSLSRLISNFMWEVGELEGTTTKASRAALKDFISLQEVTMRQPYGRNDITKPAAASLIGTINEDGAGFLNDTTGSRRFAVAKLNSINFDYTIEIDIHQVWAEIYTAYLDGERWQLSSDESTKQTEINEEYQSDSPVREALASLFEWNIEASKQRAWWLSSHTILNTLKEKANTKLYNDRAVQMEISRELKKEGLIKARQNDMWGFFGITKRDFPREQVEEDGTEDYSILGDW